MEKVRRKTAPGETRNAPGRPRQVRLGHLTDSLGYALRRAQMTAVAELVAALQGVDLRPTQFAVLTVVGENPGIRQSEVCAVLGIQKANFVPLLNELERRGLAQRKAAAADRRSSALHLTPLGNSILQRARVLHESCEERFVERLGRRGRNQLLALLSTVMDAG